MSISPEVAPIPRASFVGGHANKPCKHLVRAESKVLHEGVRPYTIVGQDDRRFIEEYVPRFKIMGMLRWSDR